MKKNQISNIIVHPCDNTDLKALSDRINNFHVQVIERKLNSNEFIISQKVRVLDEIIKGLRLRDKDGYIK